MDAAPFSGQTPRQQGSMITRISVGKITGGDVTYAPEMHDTKGTSEMVEEFKAGDISAAKVTLASKKTTGASYERELEELIKKLDKELETDGNINGKFQQPSEKVYKMSSKPRGKCLIVNIKEFNDGQETRHGSDKDIKRLKSLLKNKLGFKTPIVEEDLSAIELREAIKEFAEEDHSKSDIAFVAIMSHGDEGKIVANDGQSVEHSEIFEMFSDENCSSLKGKVKFFLFNHCRGAKRRLARDEGSVPKIPDDCFIAYSTDDGYISIRDEKKGSWFVTAFCEAFTKFSHEKHAEELMEHCNEFLSKYRSKEEGLTQQCAWKKTIKKYLYFNPGHFQ